MAATRRVIVIGRGSGCDVVLADDSVSRRHAELRLEPEGWTLVDLESSNGTFVVRGGRRDRCARELITRHDRLRFGTVETSLPEIFERLGMTAPPPPAAPAPPAAATVQAPAVQPPPPRAPAPPAGPPRFVRCSCGAPKQQGLPCPVCGA